jgi:hypothetical protein
MMPMSQQDWLVIGECFLSPVTIINGHIAKQALKIGIKLAR